MLDFIDQATEEFQGYTHISEDERSRGEEFEENRSQLKSESSMKKSKSSLRLTPSEGSLQPAKETGESSEKDSISQKPPKPPSKKVTFKQTKKKVALPPEPPKDEIPIPPADQLKAVNYPDEFLLTVVCSFLSIVVDEL